MAQWKKNPRLAVHARRTHEIQKSLIPRWRAALPARHQEILRPNHEFMQSLQQLVRQGYSVIEFSRNRDKKARWNELKGSTPRTKSKVDMLGVIQERYVRAADPYERGTLVEVRHGHMPTIVYDRKKGGADLDAMKGLLRGLNPFFHRP